MCRFCGAVHATGAWRLRTGAIADPPATDTQWLLYTYDAAGHTTKAIYQNGVTSTFVYSLLRGWITSISHALAGTAFETKTYAHDAGGRITGIDSTLPNQSWTYTYDRLDRLTKVERDDQLAVVQPHHGRVPCVERAEMRFRIAVNDARGAALDHVAPP